MEYAPGGRSTRAPSISGHLERNVRDHIVEVRRATTDRVVVAGAHRFDVYRPPLSGVDRVAWGSREVWLELSRPIGESRHEFHVTKYHRRKPAIPRGDWKRLGLSRLPPIRIPRSCEAGLGGARADPDLVKMLLQADRPAAVLKPHPTEEHERYLACEGMRGRARSRVASSARLHLDILNSADLHLHRMSRRRRGLVLDVP